MQMRTPTGSRWISKIYITRYHRRLELVQFEFSSKQSQFEFQSQLESVADKMPVWKQLQTEGWALSDRRLSSPARMRKKCCYGQRNLGSICSSLSPSPTHLSHITNINPFATLSRIKCERYIFLKKCVRSSLLLTMFPHIVVYVYVYIELYVAIQHSYKLENI